MSNAALKPLSAGDLNDIILKSTTPLIDAVKDNDIDGVKRHIDSHKRKQRLDGMTALMIAAVTNNVEAGRILLDDEENEVTLWIHCFALCDRKQKFGVCQAHGFA